MKFNIKLSPQRRDDDELEIAKRENTLIINGVEYNFTPLGEGASITAEAIDCKFIVGEVKNTNDVIDITFILPIKINASNQARFPQPIFVENDGKVVLPE